MSGFIRDRQREGIEAAKAKGIYKGQPDAKHVASGKTGRPLA
jgi:DNA invertase Pin-like site-specific DNA recombinase